jgi:putative two-component system response regulator
VNVDAAVYSARILIVDDQAANVLLLERLLSTSGFTSVVSTTVSGEVPALCDQHAPDILLLDLQMPAPDGFEVMAMLDERMNGPERMPVLILTADPSSESKRRALLMGASDFLGKPFDATEAVLRIRNLLLTHVLQMELRRQNASLEQRVRTRTRQLDDSRIEVVERLARAAEYRDDNTGRHTRRVGRTAALLAKILGHADDFVERIGRAAPLHDVGKIGISDAILLKPGRLTPDEFEAMKQHTRIGAEILGQNRSKLMRLSEEIALTHHEHWDGSGYPAGLAGESIPISGRIVAVADVFDALTHKRPYKEAWPPEDALAEMQRLSGSYFDPSVVEALVEIGLHELLADRAPSVELVA